jgi:hypothetical protein
MRHCLRADNLAVENPSVLDELSAVAILVPTQRVTAVRKEQEDQQHIKRLQEC